MQFTYWATAWAKAEEGLPLMPLFKENDFQWVEAPLPLDDLEGHARFQGFGVPIGGGDLGLTTHYKYREMFEVGRIDIAQPDDLANKQFFIPADKPMGCVRQHGAGRGCTSTQRTAILAEGTTTDRPISHREPTPKWAFDPFDPFRGPDPPPRRRCRDTCQSRGKRGTNAVIGIRHAASLPTDTVAVLADATSTTRDG